MDSQGLNLGIYSIFWSKTRRAGVAAAQTEGRWLAMTVLTVLPTKLSLVCSHCWYH